MRNTANKTSDASADESIITAVNLSNLKSKQIRLIKSAKRAEPEEGVHQIETVVKKEITDKNEKLIAKDSVNTTEGKVEHVVTVQTITEQVSELPTDNTIADIEMKKPKAIRLKKPSKPDELEEGVVKIETVVKKQITDEKPKESLITPTTDAKVEDVVTVETIIEEIELKKSKVIRRKTKPTKAGEAEGLVVIESVVKEEITDDKLKPIESLITPTPEGDVESVITVEETISDEVSEVPEDKTVSEIELKKSKAIRRKTKPTKAGEEGLVVIESAVKEEITDEKLLPIESLIIPKSESTVESVIRVEETITEEVSHKTKKLKNKVETETIELQRPDTFTEAGIKPEEVSVKPETEEISTDVITKKKIKKLKKKGETTEEILPAEEQTVESELTEIVSESIELQRSDTLTEAGVKPEEVSDKPELPAEEQSDEILVTKTVSETIELENTSKNCIEQLKPSLKQLSSLKKWGTNRDRGADLNRCQH